MDDERDYLRTCERRERRMARQAGCARAREAHEHLARIYAERLAALGPMEGGSAEGADGEPSLLAMALQRWRRPPSARIGGRSLGPVFFAATGSTR